MSFHYFSIDGYGAKIDKINPTKESIEKLLENAPKVKESFGEFESAIDVLDYEGLSGFGLCSLIADVIKEKENILFDVCDDFDGKQYILCCPIYPWSNFDNIEEYKKLTPEKINLLLEKYIRMVDEKAIYDLDYQSCENGG